MSANSIERRSRPTRAEFAMEWLYPRRPLVITGVVEGWVARTRWTPAFFKERYGSMPLHVKNQPYTLGGFLPRKEDGRPLTLGEFIDLVLESKEAKPAPYLRNVHVEQFLPELNADLQPLPEYFHPNWLAGPLTRPLDSRLHGGRFELFIGGAGGKFPVLHFDTWHIHTFLTQIYGVKKYTMFAPDQTAFLYPRGNQSQVDLENPDLEKFPLFARATRIEVDLGPGEILFVPAGWWHTAKMLSPSITVSASRVNDSNWPEFSEDLKSRAPLPVRPLVSAYLTSLRLVHAISRDR